MSSIADKGAFHDLSVVIVNYNGGELLKACLESVFAETRRVSLEVIVVDNDSVDGSPEMVQGLFPRVKLIRNPQNVGFAQANNQAIKISSGRHIMLLNPDTVVFSSTLSQLVGFMDSHGEAALAGCRLVSSQGDLQYSMRNYPSLINHLFEAFFIHHLWPGISHIFGEVIYRREHYEAIRRVDWVSGAAMIVRREILSEVGLLDEGFFLYSEEMDWCRRITQAGYHVYYCPTASIVHYEGEFKKNPRLLLEDIKSRRRYYSKHYSPIAAAILGRTMYINFSLRAALYCLASVWPRNRSAAEKRSLYLQGLRALRVPGGEGLGEVES